MGEEDYRRAVNGAHSWGDKAIAASWKADEFRSAGNTVAPTSLMPSPSWLFSGR